MKGAFAMKHLIKDASHSIDVTFEVNGPSALEALWSQIERSPKKGLCVVFLIVEFFG